MAVTVTLTGTAQNITASNGSPNITVTNTTGWAVGATIQGTGITAGTKIVSFVANTSAVLSNAYTGTTGTVSVIVSSVYGSVITVQLSASGDTATPQNIITAGFGTLQGSSTILFAGAESIQLNVAQGAVYNDSNWTYELGIGGRLRFNETYGTGEWRSGYMQPSTGLFVSTAGHTVKYRNWNNNGAGGSSIFFNSGQPTGYPTNKALIRWNDCRWVEMSGANAGAILQSAYSNFNCGTITFDYDTDTNGANATKGFAFGTIDEIIIRDANSGITATNGTNFGTFKKITYLGSLNQSGTDAKFGIPNNYSLSSFAPQFDTTQATLRPWGVYGGDNGATQIFVDPIFPTGYDFLNKTYTYSGPRTVNLKRTLNLSFKDSSATDLTGITLYVTSGSTVLVNAVQSTALFSQSVTFANLIWTTTTGTYRAADTKNDYRSQTIKARKYGKIEQSISYSLQDNSFTQPFYFLDDSSLTGISEATASDITTAGINWSTKTITPTGNLSYDQLNARIAWELAQTTNSDKTDPRSITGSNLTLATGWTLIVNNGITISSGSKITYWYTPTITLNGTGKITGVYGTTAGTSTVLELNTVSNGYSLCLYQNGTTKYFQSNVNAGSYYVYLSPSEAGTYTLAAENYGQKRTQDTLVLNGGSIWYNIIDSEDVGITDTKTNVAAYTTLSTTSQIYDATAYFRLSETGIKLGQLVARDGLYLDFGSYNVKLKDDNASIISVASGTITYKSIVVNETTKYNAMKATPPATITVTDNELINVVIEDANGDSQLTILGGDNLGYELWKITTSTATDDYATGTLLTTLATNTTPYRFIGVTGYDIVGRDISSGVRRRSSMAKGVYEQAFYVGNQIQLASDAPQLVENNEKLSEVITKLDAKLDVAISTRLATIDYEAPHNTEIDAIKLKVDTLENTDLTGVALETTSQEIKDKVITLPTLAEMESPDSNIAKQDLLQNVNSVTGSTDATVNSLAGADFDGMTDSLDAISTKVDTIQTAVSALENYDDTILEGKVDDIKTKVLTLENYNDATAQAKLDAIKAKTDTLVNTDLTGIATATDVTNAKDEVLTAISEIPATDLTEVQADLNIINEGVQKASIFKPHTTNL